MSLSLTSRFFLRQWLLLFQILIFKSINSIQSTYLRCIKVSYCFSFNFYLTKNILIFDMFWLSHRLSSQCRRPCNYADRLSIGQLIHTFCKNFLKSFGSEIRCPSDPKWDYKRGRDLWKAAKANFLIFLPQIVAVGDVCRSFFYFTSTNRHYLQFLESALRSGVFLRIISF